MFVSGKFKVIYLYMNLTLINIHITTFMLHLLDLLFLYWNDN